MLCFLKQMLLSTKPFVPIELIEPFKQILLKTQRPLQKTLLRKPIERIELIEPFKQILLKTQRPLQETLLRSSKSSI
jgi:hypothetical protein